MDADDEDEEDEDAEWSQLPTTATTATTPAGSVPAQDNSSDANATPKLKRCLDAVETDVWNTDAWLALMSEVQQLPIADARAHYERFLERFPTSVRRTCVCVSSVGLVAVANACGLCCE